MVARVSSERGRRGLTRALGLFVLALGAALTGCGSDAPPAPAAPSGRWPCPPTWVAGAQGGCGPAVLLCADGGAAPGACDGVDLARAPTIASDGGAVTGFSRLPDGGIGGGWPEPGDPDGPPAEDWSPTGVPDDDWEPDAGVGACPDGWRRAADGTCDPALRDDCEAGSSPVPGGACTPTGASSCPAGDYADPGAEAVGATVVHVRAGADAGAADGSEARPFATLAEGLARAGDGGWVLVARGEYAETIRVAAGASAHVLGACAARVTVRGPGPAGTGGVPAVAAGAGARLDLRGVTVTGAGRGLQASGGGSLRATGVAVDASTELAVDARGAGSEVSLTGCAIRDTRPRAEGSIGRAVSAQAGAAVRATGTALERATEIAVHALDPGTRVALRGCALRDTRPVAGARGFGIFVEAGASVEAEGSVLLNNADVGAFAQGAVGAPPARSRVTLRASIVRATRPRQVADDEGNLRGIGVLALAGAVVDAEDVLVDGNASAGLQANGVGSSITLVRAVVRETAPADGALGVGLYAINGARIAADGVRIAGNHTAGVTAHDPETSVTLRGCVVRDTRPDAPNVRGYGLAIQTGASVTAEATLLAGNTAAGVFVTGAGSRAELTRCAVRGTRPGGDGQGPGLSATLGGRVRAEATALTRNVESGASADGAGSRIDLTACVVRETAPNALGRRGRGLNAQNGGAASAADTLFERNTEVGVAALAPGSRVELTSCVIRGTLPRRDGVAGEGLAASDGATLTASRVRVAYDAEAAVLAIGAAAELALNACALRHTGEASGTRAGVGLVAADGASLRAEGVTVDRAVGAGALTQGAGSRLALTAAAVRGTRPLAVGILGRGADASGGASLTARATLLEGGAEFGVSVFGAGSAAALDDVIVARVAASARGFGVGLACSGGAQVAGSRVAVVDVAGGGVTAVPLAGQAAPRVDLGDLLVRGVVVSTIRAREDAPATAPQGCRVAHGIHVGTGSAVTLRRGLLDGADFGFYTAGGAFQFAVGAVVRQRVAAGAVGPATPPGAPPLTDVALRGNAHDAVLRDGTLPCDGSLAPPALPDL